MKLSEIVSQKQAVAFEVTLSGEVIITGRCVPGMISESSLQGIVEAENAMKTGDMTSSDMLAVIGSQSSMIANSVREWDLEDEDGKPYPITREAIAKIDAEILGAIFVGIMSAQRPNEVTAEQS